MFAKIAVSSLLNGRENAWDAESGIVLLRQRFQQEVQSPKPKDET